MRLILLSVLLLTLAGCSGFDDQSRAIVFRQHELEHLWDTPRQAYLDARFNEVDQVCRTVFEALPSVCKVYMTEGYYYFRASLIDCDISGNFRVQYNAGNSPPVVNFAYFDVDHPRSYHTKLLRDDDPDVTIRPLAPGRVEVRYAGMTRIFVDATAEARCHDQSIRLAEHERFITGVMDESGVRFELIFNTKTNYFYYLLAEDGLQGDEWTPIDNVESYRVLLGQRSKFVLLDNPNDHRTLLIGISSAQVQRNTYYDGPFDQVPPDLDLQEQLCAAYPYVAFGRGIDAHGNFLDREDVRVAISPYQTYENLEALIELVRQAVHTHPSFDQLHQTLCYESKRDFNPESTHDLPTRNWPANHFSTVSYSWGKTQQASPP